MDLTSSSSASVLQSVKERMREKLNGSLKVVKLQTSLAAKIKTKTLNNSSLMKVSLKHNNKALACALTAEREKARRLENDKMFLQKEVKMLHFQNALLRQNQSIVNKMLKDIDVFMNINLSAAIEISNTMESTDRLSLNETKSERLSQQSSLTMDEDQGYRLTGVALRVPSNSVLQQKCNSQQTILDNEENYPNVPLSPIVTVVRRNCNTLDEPELHTKEYRPVCKENTSRDSLSNCIVSDSILPVDEEFSFSNRIVQSGGYVTKRRKRSTVSRSGSMSKTSESNQTRCSKGLSSSPSKHWELKENTIILPDSEHTGLDGAERSCIDSVLKKDRLSTIPHNPSLSERMETEQSSYVGKDISNGLYKEQAIQSTNQMEPSLNKESDHQIVDGYVGQEKTVYEADMEMTSSESVSIIAVLPKKKAQASKTKSGIPVQKSVTLRKIKKSVREKNKKTECSVVSNSSDSNEKGEPSDRFMEDVLSDIHERRTYVLPGPVAQERPDVQDSKRQSSLEVSVSRESSVTGQIFSNDFTVLNGGKIEMTFNVEKDHWTEVCNTADMTPKKRKSRIKEASHMESSKKKKRKMQKTSVDQKQLAEEHDKKNESTEQMDSSKEINTIPIIQVKTREKKIQRQTYVVSTPQQHRVTNDPLAKADEVHYRRETFMIPEPNPLVTVTLKTSVSEEKNDTIVEPQNDINSLVSTVVSPKTENGAGTKKSDSEKELCIPASYHDNTCGNKKRVSRCLEKKAPSGLFSELDKKKTHVLPSKQDRFRSEKGTLVRESFMNLKSSQSNNAGKFTDMTNRNDSFMLDMVSESILENTMEFSSFAEFPSATNSESTFTIDMSLKSIPVPELPVSEDCSNKELCHGLPSVNVLDDSDHPQDTHETESGTNRQCKVEDQSIEIQDTAIKPFQDMTNKSLSSTKQSPKTRSEEEESDSHCRRRRNPVNYKEPSLGKKLRRGDKHTDTAFLSSTVIKGKTKQGGGRNKKKVKPEECRTDDT